MQTAYILVCVNTAGGVFVKRATKTNSLAFMYFASNIYSDDVGMVGFTSAHIYGEFATQAKSTAVI